jgi:mRNA-degrading endonuclease toxin of MazEF toxin-antitoxin module
VGTTWWGRGVTAARGEVRTLGGRKVAVMSADAVSATGWPWCAPIVRQVQVPAALAVFCVQTHETDPVSGVILLLEMRPVPDEQLGTAVGTLVGATFARLEDGIRALFDLA